MLTRIAFTPILCVMTLRQARRAAHLTQSALAAKAGVGQDFISRLETGDAKNPSHRAVMAICRALHVNPQDITEFANGGRL